MDNLTATQAKVFKFVKSYANKHGMPPTRKEICNGFGWASYNAAQGHIAALHRKGYLRMLGGKLSRGIVILK